MISRLTAGLQYPLYTLHERRCRRPCKTRFRLAGSASTGRVSNPLDHDERFQVTSVLLSRAYPDASWAHARRKFFELADIEAAARQRARKKVAVIAPLALEAVRRMDELFAIEREVNGRPTAERLAARHERSAPIVAALEGWMRAERARLPRGAEVARAMDYMLERWPSFARFLDDGRVCLSNNAAERALRGLALGRKAWLFAGSDRGGQRAAFFNSLIVTAKLNDVDPQAWLADVLGRIASHPAQRLAELLPWNWKPTSAAPASLDVAA